METLEEIKSGLRNGDWRKLAVITGLGYDNVRKTLNRPNAKRHEEVKEAAQKIAKMNRQLGL